MRSWQLEDWAAVRVAGLSAAFLPGLRLQAAPTLVDELVNLRRSADALRPALVDDLHEAVVHGDDLPAESGRNLRRLLLKLKRDIYNGRAIPLQNTLPDRVPPRLLARLEELARFEQQLHALGEHFEKAFDEECQAIRRRIIELAQHPHVLNGLLLSSNDLVQASERLPDWSRHARLSRRQARRLASEGTYVLRAITRTTPFSTFAAVALVALHDPSDEASDRAGVTWRSEPQLHARLLSHWLEKRLEDADLPSRMTPIQSLVDRERRQFQFVQPAYPRPEGRPPQLRHIAGSLQQRALEAQPLHTAADLLEQYRTASPTARGQILSTLRTLFDDGVNARAPLYEDVVLEPVSAARLEVSPRTLADDLVPVLQLARAALTNLPHYFICEAFVKRYGLDGRCDDIGAFLVHLLQEGFAPRIRYVQMPPAWLQSPLLRASETVGQAIVLCDPEWFADLPQADQACAVALFVQIAADDEKAVARGDYRVVLNGVQSGRHKYLSRFLGGETATARRALEEIRADFASLEPLLVGISPALGMNFQLHPWMCAWQIELPHESPCGNHVLPLSDLSLMFDENARRLRLSSKSLQREVDLVHLGFLRDSNLPDALLLLRALSPGYADDLLSERMAVYDTIDLAAVANDEPIPPFRPRLEVGRVVLERARWAVRLDDVPLPRPGEKEHEFFRRIVEWCRIRNLPERAMAQRCVTGRPGSPVISTPRYVDWHSPLTLATIERLVGGRPPQQAAGWLLLRELLPRPEDARFHIGGAPHVAEWMIQFRG